MLHIKFGTIPSHKCGDVAITQIIKHVTTAPPVEWYKPKSHPNIKHIIKSAYNSYQVLTKYETSSNSS